MSSYGNDDTALKAAFHKAGIKGPQDRPKEIALKAACGQSVEGDVMLSKLGGRTHMLTGNPLVEAKRDMTRDEIEQEIEKILLEKAENLKSVMDIKDQVAQAKARVITHGQYSDPRWFASANTALRIAGHKDQVFGTRLRVLRKQLKELGVAQAGDNTPTFERMFIQVAKSKLTGEQYAMLYDETKKALSPFEIAP